jgi:zinc transport system substrate-binding protein
VALQEAEGLVLLEAGPAGLHEHAPGEAHPDHEPAPSGGEDVHGKAINPHLWLDPRNAQAMVRAIAAALARADPAHAPAYRANAARLTAELAALEERLTARLAPVRDRPFLVYHDAYPYFVRRFGLNTLGEITTTPERAPGARRILEVRSRLRAAGAVCVFSEPSFQPRLLETVTADSDARTGVLDPLGAGLTPGPGLYLALLRNLATALVDCLSGAGKAP